MSERPPRWVPWACVAGVVLLSVLFFGVACSTSWARIAVLNTVDLLDVVGALNQSW